MTRRRKIKCFGDTLLLADFFVSSGIVINRHESQRKHVGGHRRTCFVDTIAIALYRHQLTLSDCLLLEPVIMARGPRDEFGRQLAASSHRHLSRQEARRGGGRWRGAADRRAGAPARTDHKQGKKNSRRRGDRRVGCLPKAVQSSISWGQARCVRVGFREVVAPQRRLAISIALQHCTYRNAIANALL